eukprot:1181098-Prorocentrum_minimum.AAC.2
MYSSSSEDEGSPPSAAPPTSTTGKDGINTVLRGEYTQWLSTYITNLGCALNVALLILARELLLAIAIWVERA